MRFLASALLFSLASLGTAHVEKEFKLPDIVRQPFFDISMEAGPLPDIESVAPERIVSINHVGVPLQCVLPEKAVNAMLTPLTDVDTIAAARAVLADYKSSKYMHLDDVWGWRFRFDKDIIQFFPEEGPSPGSFHFSTSSFQVHIGKDDDAPGHVSLDDALPVVVDDQHMLYTRFVNGTRCDLTLEPRAANVFFACAADAEPNVPVILSIDEPYSCTYEFVVGLNELCEIEPFFNPQISMNTIKCGLDPEAVIEQPEETPENSVEEGLPEDLSGGLPEEVKDLKPTSHSSDLDVDQEVAEPSSIGLKTETRDQRRTDEDIQHNSRNGDNGDPGQRSHDFEDRRESEFNSGDSAGTEAPIPIDNGAELAQDSTNNLGSDRDEHVEL